MMDVMRPNVTQFYLNVRIYISRSPAIEHSRRCCTYISFLFPNKLSHIYKCIKWLKWKTIDSFFPSFNRNIRLKQAKKKKLIRIFICVYLKLKADYRWWKYRVSVFICSINSLWYTVIHDRFAYHIERLIETKIVCCNLLGMNKISAGLMQWQKIAICRGARFSLLLHKSSARCNRNFRPEIIRFEVYAWSDGVRKGFSVSSKKSNR